MCINCYFEAGRPKVINNKTIVAAQLIKELYEQEGFESGGYAHIVTDDWNLDDSDINFCLNAAKSGEHGLPQKGTQVCIKVLTYLKKLTEDERYSAMAIERGFIELAQ